MKFYLKYYFKHFFFSVFFALYTLEIAFLFLPPSPGSYHLSWFHNAHRQVFLYSSVVWTNGIKLKVGEFPQNCDGVLCSCPSLTLAWTKQLSSINLEIHSNSEDFFFFF